MKHIKLCVDCENAGRMTYARPGSASCWKHSSERATAAATFLNELNAYRTPVGPPEVKVTLRDKYSQNTPELLMPWVYLMRAKGTQFFKIGFSKTPRLRKKRMQTAQPVEIVVECIVSAESYFEKELHAQFARFRRNGEWFCFDDGGVAVRRSFALLLGGFRYVYRCSEMNLIFCRDPLSGDVLTRDCLGIGPKHLVSYTQHGFSFDPVIGEWIKKGANGGKQ